MSTGAIVNRPNEMWKPIRGYEGMYDISNQGRIRSYYNKGKRKTESHPQQIKSAPILLSGYKSAQLKKDKKYVNRPIHQLVLEAFVSPRPPGMEACHKNNIKTDNRAENLTWDTHRNNMTAYSEYPFGSNSGSNSPNSKLIESQVWQIRRLYATGHYTQQKIAGWYNITRECVGVIVRRKRWRHI